MASVPITTDGSRLPSRPTSRVPFQSDASCWVSHADYRPEGDLPGCYRCGAVSAGANFREFEGRYPAGRVSGIVEFTCGCDGRRQYAIRAETWGATWRIVSELEPGVVRVVKRNEREKLEATKR